MVDYVNYVHYTLPLTVGSLTMKPNRSFVWVVTCLLDGGNTTNKPLFNRCSLFSPEEIEILIEIPLNSPSRRYARTHLMFNGWTINVSWPDPVRNVALNLTEPKCSDENKSPGFRGTRLSSIQRNQQQPTPNIVFNGANVEMDLFGPAFFHFHFSVVSFAQKYLHFK